MKGVGIDARNGPLACGDHERVGASWWHNWSYDPAGCPVGGFVPTIYNKSQMYKRPPGVTSGGPVLGFNEPDQAEMSPEDAAYQSYLMVMYYQMWKGSWQVVGHTASTLSMFNGWYERYLAELDRLSISCLLHGLSINIYPEWGDEYDHLERVMAWAAERDIPTVWVKEYRALYPELGRRFVAWAMGHEQVHLAWFIARTPEDMARAHYWESPLLTLDGELTPFGIMYQEL